MRSRRGAALLATRRSFALIATLAALVLLVAAPAGAQTGADVEPVGSAPDLGDLVAVDTLGEPVGIAASLGPTGYWVATDQGQVHAFGEAADHGDLAEVALNLPVVGIASTASGEGYWMVASDGGIFTFGDAGFFGSTGDIELNRPIVGMAATPSGGGYWMVASDGGIFTFGDAGFFGSTGDVELNSPVIGMIPTPSGQGYWLVASDGGVFTFGDAGFLGSAAELGGQAVIGLIDAPESEGYAVVRADGSLIPFGEIAVAGRGPQCQADPAVAATANDVGAAWVLRRPVPFERGPASARSAGIDGEAVDALLDRAQACQSPQDPAALAWTDPLPGTRLSSRFGSRVHPIWGVRQLHAGTDLAAPTGTPVRAAAAGQVVAVIETPLVAYGRIVVLDHGGRIGSVYAHLSAAAVRPGQQLAAGEVLGAVGTSGFATGAHLHVEIRVEGEPIDPAPLLGR